MFRDTCPRVPRKAACDTGTLSIGLFYFANQHRNCKRCNAEAEMSDHNDDNDDNDEDGIENAYGDIEKIKVNTQAEHVSMQRQVGKFFTILKLHRTNVESP